MKSQFWKEEMSVNILFDYIVALTNLYGVVDKEKVIEIYNMQNEDKMDVSDVESVLVKIDIALCEHFVYVEGDYFVHESIFTTDEVGQLLQRKAGKPYYVPRKEILLQYKDDEFYEETKQTKSFYRLLKKVVHPSNVNSVEDVFYDVLLGCQMEDHPIDIIHDLDRIDVTFSTKKQLSEAIQVIIDLSNHTRLWSNNGFTPYEIFEEFEKPQLASLPENGFSSHASLQSVAESTKTVGRNELCPCGSGKKYKKCCLLNI